MGPDARISGTVPQQVIITRGIPKTRDLLFTRGRPKNRAANPLHAWKTQNPRPSLTKCPTSLTHGGVALLIGQVSPAAITADRGSPQIRQPPLSQRLNEGNVKILLMA